MTRIQRLTEFGLMGFGILGKKFRCYGKICTHYTELDVMTIRCIGVGVMGFGVMGLNLLTVLAFT